MLTWNMAWRLIQRGLDIGSCKPDTQYEDEELQLLAERYHELLVELQSLQEIVKVAGTREESKIL